MTDTRNLKHHPDETRLTGNQNHPTSQLSTATISQLSLNLSRTHDMADRRRAEIEEKRAKLAELRRARDERKALLAQAQSGGDRAADVSTAIRRFDYTI